MWRVGCGGSDVCVWGGGRGVGCFVLTFGIPMIMSEMSRASSVLSYLKEGRKERRKEEQKEGRKEGRKSEGRKRRRKERRKEGRQKARKKEGRKGGRKECRKDEGRTEEARLKDEGGEIDPTSNRTNSYVEILCRIIKV